MARDVLPLAVGPATTISRGSADIPTHPMTVSDDDDHEHDKGNYDEADGLEAARARDFRSFHEGIVANRWRFRTFRMVSEVRRSSVTVIVREQ